MINVIIPAYKARETLPGALDSLVAQTKKLFQVTVVQDGDGEDYSDILKEYRHRGLHIAWLVMPENGGPGMARQMGIDHSDRFDYVMFLDSDDMLLPNAVEIIYRAAKQNNADIIITDFLAERKYKTSMPIIADKNPVQWLHGKAYKLEYLKRIGLRFLPEMRIDEDGYFNVVAFNSTKNKYYVHENTCFWRQNPNSITRSEESTTFFKKEYKYYIHGQVQGMLDLVRINGKMNPGLLAQTLNYIYKFTMRAKHFKFDVDEVNKDVQRLRDNEIIKSTFDELDFWKVLNAKLEASEIYEEDMYFFGQRFIDWFNENLK